MAKMEKKHHIFKLPSLDFFSIMSAGNRGKELCPISFDELIAGILMGTREKLGMDEQQRHKIMHGESEMFKGFLPSPSTP